MSTLNRTQGNIQKQFEKINTFWDPHILLELNGQHVKLAKLKGEFDWHHHEEEDELFLVLKGELFIDFEDKTERYTASDYVLIPRGIKHRPHCEREVHVILFEPAGTINTGNVESDLTKPSLKWL